MCSLNCIWHFKCIPSDPLAISTTKEETSLSPALASLAILMLKCKMFQKLPRACAYTAWEWGGVNVQCGKTLTDVVWWLVNNCSSIYIRSSSHLPFTVIKIMHSYLILLYPCFTPMYFILDPWGNLSDFLSWELELRHILGWMSGPMMAFAHKALPWNVLIPVLFSVILIPLLPPAELFPFPSHDGWKISLWVFLLPRAKVRRSGL